MRTVIRLAPVVLLSSVTLANATPMALTDKLTANNGDGSDVFGWSVGISDTMAIVVAYGDNRNSGSAYLFDRTTGAQTQKLIADHWDDQRTRS